MKISNCLRAPINFPHANRFKSIFNALLIQIAASTRTQLCDYDMEYAIIRGPITCGRVLAYKPSNRRFDSIHRHYMRIETRKMGLCGIEQINSEPWPENCWRIRMWLSSRMDYLDVIVRVLQPVSCYDFIRAEGSSRLFALTDYLVSAGRQNFYLRVNMLLDL